MADLGVVSVDPRGNGARHRVSGSSPTEAAVACGVVAGS